MVQNLKIKEQIEVLWDQQKARRSHQNWGALSQLVQGQDGVSVGQAGVGLHQVTFGLGEPWETAKRWAARREKERAARGCERQRQRGVPCFKGHFSCLTQGSLSPHFLWLDSEGSDPLAHHICLARARHGGQGELLLGK